MPAARGAAGVHGVLPRGYMAEMTQVMQQFVPPTDSKHDPLSWGRPRGHPRSARRPDRRTHPE